MVLYYYFTLQKRGLKLTKTLCSAKLQSDASEPSSQLSPDLGLQRSPFVAPFCQIISLLRSVSIETSHPCYLIILDMWSNSSFFFSLQVMSDHWPVFGKGFCQIGLAQKFFLSPNVFLLTFPSTGLMLLGCKSPPVHAGFRTELRSTLEISFSLLQ